jgi:hypothetical protein
LEPNHAAAMRLLARIRLDRRIAQPRGAIHTKG